MTAETPKTPPGDVGELVERLRSPHMPAPITGKEVYRTRPVAMFEQAAVTIEQLSARVEALEQRNKALNNGI